MTNSIEINNFIKNADENYIAARCLFLNDLFIQGSITSNSAIELYLKALLSLEKTNFNRDLGSWNRSNLEPK